MKIDCEVIRDLLPLYADEACSGKSRELVEEHLRECPACREMAGMLLKTDIENELRREKESVIRYGIRQFRRRSAVVGSAVSGGLVAPILICVMVNLVLGRPALGWVSVVFAAVCVAVSLIVVPLIVREDRAFWMFWAFCASLMLLLGVVCIYTRGDWFWVASSASLFGLSAVFLPFVIKARPLRELLGDANRLLIVLGVDAALFFNMLNMISTRGTFTLGRILFAIGVIGGIAVVALAIFSNRKTDPGHEGDL